VTGRQIDVERGDITTYAVDGIVNAANESLRGGGGVDGAIHRAAGPELLEACSRLGGCATGDAKITPGFRLPARYVIHAVGPVWRGGGSGEGELLASAHRASLRLAAEYALDAVAFPAISCGAYGYPLDEAAGIAVHEVRTFEVESSPRRVIFVCFDERVESAFRRALAEAA
jgi:O-acetyl-ADP-ribose deacetylase (regulator of RNase III)